MDKQYDNIRFLDFGFQNMSRFQQVKVTTFPDWLLNWLIRKMHLYYCATKFWLAEVAIVLGAEIEASLWIVRS